METALLNFLQRLETIDERYDGLGDTNVRDRMGDDIWRGFLVPIKGFKPSGEYGLEPVANRKIAAAIAAFCRAANKAAGEQGLSTFLQRVAAFQDSSVRTKGDVEYNDYFGQIPLKDYDEHGIRKRGRGRVPRKPQALAWTFTFAGKIEKMCDALKAHPEKWEWHLNRNYREPFIDGHFNNGVWITIKAEKKPKSAFLAKMEDQFERDLQPFGEQLIAVLEGIGAKRISEIPARA